MRNQLLLRIHWNHLNWTFKDPCGWTGPSRGPQIWPQSQLHSVHWGHTRNCGPARTTTKTEHSTHPFLTCWPLAPSFVLRAAGFWSPSRKSSLSEKPGSEVLWSAPQCFKKKIQLQKKDVTYGIAIKRHILLPTPFPNVRSNSSKSIKPSDVFDRISTGTPAPLQPYERRHSPFWYFLMALIMCDFSFCRFWRTSVCTWMWTQDCYTHSKPALQMSTVSLSDRAVATPGHWLCATTTLRP